MRTGKEKPASGQPLATLSWPESGRHHGHIPGGDGGSTESRHDKMKMALTSNLCANCRRMLHRMEGKGGDIARLRALLRTHR